MHGFGGSLGYLGGKWLLSEPELARSVTLIFGEPMQDRICRPNGGF